MDIREELLTALSPTEDQFCAMVEAASRVLCDDLIEKGEITAQAQLMFSKELAIAADKMIEACEYHAAELGVELSDDFLESVRSNIINEILELTDSLIENVTELLKQADNQVV